MLPDRFNCSRSITDLPLHFIFHISPAGLPCRRDLKISEYRVHITPSSATRRPRMCCSLSLYRTFSFSFPSKMDPPYPGRSVDETYSHNPRSRTTGSRVSTTEALFQSLQLAESSPARTPSCETASYTTSRPPSSRGLASPAYNSPSLPHQSSFLTSQHSHQHPSQHQSPYQLPAEGALDTNWFAADGSTRDQAAPLLRVQPAPEELETPASSPPLASIESGAMR